MSKELTEKIIDQRVFDDDPKAVTASGFWYNREKDRIEYWHKERNGLGDGPYAGRCGFVDMKTVMAEENPDAALLEFAKDIGVGLGIKTSTAI